MKKVIAIFITILLLSTPIMAHSGRTDANGGHWDRKNGTYHFHSGEYAGRNSSSSSSTSKYTPFTPPYDPPTKNSYQTDNTQKINIKTVAVLTSIGVLLFISCLSNSLKKRIANYEASIKDYQAHIEAISNCNNILAGTVNIPSFYKIGGDNLPKKIDAIDWGNDFTVYKSMYGSKLHHKYGCCNAIEKMHICNFLCYRDIQSLLCSKCCKDYKIPDMKWYIDFLKYQKAQQDYPVLMDKTESIYKKMLSSRAQCNFKAFAFLLLFWPKRRKMLKELNNLCDDVIKSPQI